MFRYSYTCRLKVKVDRSGDLTSNICDSIEIYLFRTLILILIFSLLYTCVMPSLLTAQQIYSSDKKIIKKADSILNSLSTNFSNRSQQLGTTIVSYKSGKSEEGPSVWAGTNNAGVWFFENGNWNHLSNGLGDAKVYNLQINPFDPNVLIAITPNGVYRTEDKGMNWTLVNMPFTQSGWQAVYWDRANYGDVVISGPDLGTVFDTDPRAAVSHDAGVTWSGIALDIGPGNGLTAEARPGDVWGFNGHWYMMGNSFHNIVLGWPYHRRAFWRSIDRGNTWELLGTWPGEQWDVDRHVTGLWTDPNHIFGTFDHAYANPIIESPDAGTTWIKGSQYLHTQRQILADPVREDTLWLIAQGNLYNSAADINNFQLRYSGVGTAAIDGYEGIVYAGGNNRKMAYSIDGGKNWVRADIPLGGSAKDDTHILFLAADLGTIQTIVQGSDDAGINAITCDFSISHPEIYFGECTDGRDIVSGFRFQNIPVSQPDEVQSAYIEFTVDGPYTNDIHIQFWGDISYSSQTFSDMSRPSNRPLTSQSVDWILSPADVWNMDEKKNSPDLTPLIQEIVGRYGWQRGNAISIIVKNKSSNKNHRRVFASEREGPAKAAKLIINRARPIGITVTPTEINLGSHYADSPFEALLTIKNTSYRGIATGSISANAAWISSIDPSNFSLARDVETAIRISGKFPFHLGPFETVVKINLSLPEQREIKVRIYGNVIIPNPPTTLINGSFVMANYYVGDRRAFQRLLDEMHALNLTTIILHSIGNIANSGDISILVPIADIGWMLDDASRRGMNVYIGMYSDEAPAQVEDEFWKDTKMRLIIHNSVQAVTEIERLFPSHLYPCLKGYYVPQEANVGLHQLDDFGGTKGINPFYTDLISQVHAAAPNKKVIAGGYMMQKKVEIEKLKEWVRGFKSNGLDIFLLQDGVGSFDNSLTTYPTMYNHFVAAREGASPIPLWAVIELFQWSLKTEQGRTDPPLPGDNWLHPANTIRINQQIYFANAAGAAEKISWINQRHMSHTARDSYTAFGQETEHLYRGYKALYFTGTYYQNLSYSCSPQPSPHYPDRGGMLFDTIEGQSSLSEWIGFGQSENSKVTIIVDLGTIKPVSDITAVVRSEMGSLTKIYYPKTMSVMVSTDGTNYSFLGDMTNDYLNTVGYSKAYLWVSAAASQLARYVKIEFIHGGYWLFLSELEVYHETENTVVSVKDEPQCTPNGYLLMQNYPNPFNSETKICYQLPEKCQVSLIIYNMLGQQISELVNQEQPAGFHSVLWDGKNDQSQAVASGVYLLVMNAKQFRHVKKLLLLR